MSRFVCGLFYAGFYFQFPSCQASNFQDSLAFIITGAAIFVNISSLPDALDGIALNSLTVARALSFISSYQVFKSDSFCEIFQLFQLWEERKKRQ